MVCVVGIYVARWWVNLIVVLLAQWNFQNIHTETGNLGTNACYSYSGEEWLQFQLKKLIIPKFLVVFLSPRKHKLQ